MVAREEARHVAQLAGGRSALLEKARQDLGSEDFQWAAQLCDQLIALDPHAKAPKLIKADALEAIAEDVQSGIGRNYYLTVAQELRADARK